MNDQERKAEIKRNFTWGGLPEQPTEEILDLDEQYPEDRCACGAHLYTETEYEQGWCFECVDNARDESVGSRITEGFLLHEEDAD